MTCNPLHPTHAPRLASHLAAEALDWINTHTKGDKDGYYRKIENCAG